MANRRNKATGQGVQIYAGDDLLTRFGNGLTAIGEGKARQVLARAVNRTTRSAHSRTVRALAKQSSIPLKLLRKAVRMDLASHKGSGPIIGKIYATGKPISLKHFKPKQFSFGVRAKVWGKTERFPSAFIYGDNWKSGKLAFDGHVMEREGKGRFPVVRINGPSIPAEMLRGPANEAFHQTVRDMLPARIQHELNRMLSKL